MSAFESLSTWKQPLPDKSSAERQALLDLLARRIVTLKPSRIRVAIDGYTASGKTTFGHELAAAVRALGRPTLRASLDDFKRPWRDAIDKGYDRVLGDGYYRNAPDFESARELLLRPAGSDGSGSVVVCAHDPPTCTDHRDAVVAAPADAVLIVDSVFSMRPEYIEFWDFTIWLDIDDDLSLERGVKRDAAMEGFDAAERLHRDRYRVAEEIYVTEVDPISLVDVVIDNTHFLHPRIIPSA